MSQAPLPVSILDPSEFKFALMNDIINNKKIVDAFESDDPKFVEGEPSSLIFTHVFPFLRIPDTTTVAKTYVLMAVNYDNVDHYSRKLNTCTYTDVTIILWAMAHHTMMEFTTPSGRPATRIDYISQELRRMFDGTTKFGFNKLRLIQRHEIVMEEGKHHYVELIFKTNDQRRPITANGKGWDGLD